MLLKDNEEKRNIAWRTVMTVTSVLIILIVALNVILQKRRAVEQEPFNIRRAS